MAERCFRGRFAGEVVVTKVFLTDPNAELLAFNHHRATVRLAFGDTNAIQVDGGDHTVSGRDGKDRIYLSSGSDVAGNQTWYGGGGNDSLLASIGNDLLSGGAGADTMAGAGNADVFVFSALTDCGTVGDQIDNINFFVAGAAGADRIDLSQIDAQTRSAGFQHFEFIGTAAFSHALQLRAVQVGSSRFLLINTDGVNGAELKICLVGLDATTLGIEGFIL